LTQGNRRAWIPSVIGMPTMVGAAWVTRRHVVCASRVRSSAAITRSL
jgi:hypothetical protein